MWLAWVIHHGPCSFEASLVKGSPDEGSRVWGTGISGGSDMVEWMEEIEDSEDEEDEESTECDLCRLR